MDQIQNHSGETKSSMNEKDPIKESNNIDMSNESSQCDYVTHKTSNLGRHLKIHSGEKLNKCNQ